MGVLSLLDSESNIPMWAHYANNHRGYCVIFELDFSHIFRLMPKFQQKDQPEFMNTIPTGEEMLQFQHEDKNGQIINFCFTKIRYQETIPVIYRSKFERLFQENDNECKRYVIKNTIGVKYKQWEYENEYRLISNLTSEKGNLYDMQGYMPFLKVTGVIMGYKLSDTEKDIIKYLATKHDVELYQASCSKTEYKIEITKVDPSYKQNANSADIKQSEIITADE